jgi:hypothetical protein
VSIKEARERIDQLASERKARLSKGTQLPTPKPVDPRENEPEIKDQPTK